MIFNSVTYLVFLIFVCSLFWMAPKRARLWIIFISSITFYGFWRLEFLSIIGISIVVDYFSARKIFASKDRRYRKRWLLFSLSVNLGLLAYFKYTFFFLDNGVALLSAFGLEDIEVPFFNIILPLGISFYTFQTISYTIDVYRGEIPANEDFLLFACFVTFFPQLVAGPILRGKELLYQLDTESSFKLQNLFIGAKRILYGLFLKVVFADNIATYVDYGFSVEATTLSALDVCTLAFLFGFQIYFDFSAYSHIAIGSARLVGIYFPENFNFPYLSLSPKDFWRRWHISLSSWVRDYLYLPLLNKTGKASSLGGMSVISDGASRASFRHLLVLMLTWALMGLWHGASWRFVTWGVIHATLIYSHRIIELKLGNSFRRSRKVIGWCVTLFLVMLAWLPFRTETLHDTAEMYMSLVEPERWTWLGLPENTYLVATATMLGVLSFGLMRKLRESFAGLSVPFTFIGRSLYYTCLFSGVLIFLRPINQFIYFQF